MGNTKDYNYLSAYTDELRSKGRYSFTTDDLKLKFNVSENAINKSLQRLKEKKEIAIIRKGFYVIVTPEYRRYGVLPPLHFVSALMKYLKRDYYVSLLNAAAYYGAAHQQPQAFLIMTKKPVLHPIKNNRLKIIFCYKQEWAKEDIVERKTDVGYVNVSSPELTALDLINYNDRCGGFNRVATILQELAESINPDQLAKTAERYNQVATAQRLGYLLEFWLENKELTIPLANYLSTIKSYPILLSPDAQSSVSKKVNNKWKVVPNIEIETDL